MNIFFKGFYEQQASGTRMDLDFSNAPSRAACQATLESMKRPDYNE
jgi:hypothetical protein